MRTVSCFVSAASSLSQVEHLVEVMPKQNKSVLQKQYRNKELDGFSLVRTEIRHATGGELDPKTRQDVLRKAARLIKELSVLNTKLQQQLYKYRSGSETPPSYVGGLSPCTQDSYSPLHEYFIEQSNSGYQPAEIRPPSELHSSVASTYELCDAMWDAMSLGNIGTTPACNQVISQVNPDNWSSGRQYYNYDEQYTYSR